MKEFASIMLSKQSAVPVYRQLGDAFYALIKEGALPPHKKLPPIRAMAQGLRVNNDTVINAYKYLESKGIVYSVVGSGTYVSEAPAEDFFPAEAVKDYLKRRASPSLNVFGFYINHLAETI